MIAGLETAKPGLKGRSRGDPRRSSITHSGHFKELGPLLKLARDLAKVQTGYELAWQGKGRL